MNEVWKDIEWYEWVYQISNLGRVKSLKFWKERILKPQKNNCWYLFIWLKNNFKKHLTVHRIVAKHFIPNTENKPQVNHKNWIKTDNRVENLEWMTVWENAIHSYDVLWNKNIYFWKIWKDSPFSIKVNQYTMEWVFIKTWDSIADITRSIWIHNTNISKCCLWKRKTTWKYIWKFAN